MITWARSDATPLDLATADRADPIKAGSSIASANSEGERPIMVWKLESTRIGVIGLGYVGLPLAVAFAKKFDVVGFDINATRVKELENGHDRTLEVSERVLAEATRLTLTANPDLLSGVNVYIITTPTPIDEHKNPDMRAIQAATRTVASYLRKGDTVIYESTVYPGATEEECVPLLEQLSGLKFNEDFFAGYSPERINPGDREHRFETITKVTSGSTPQAARFIDDLYRSVVTAGTHLAPSIRVAEAAKVIENTQRDVNIALINELAVVFNRLGIDTHDVLAAAGTKWNFLRFQPGLVGGHCIGVDPYYLTHKAEAIGYHPELILAGRRINDGMGSYVASELVKRMIRDGMDLRTGKVLVLGLTFKENTPDLRNTKVIDVVAALREFDLDVDVHDPWADLDEAKHEYDLTLTTDPERGIYDAVVLAVSHSEFVRLGPEGIRAFGNPAGHVVYDLKGVLRSGSADMRL